MKLIKADKIEMLFTKDMLVKADKCAKIARVLLKGLKFSTQAKANAVLETTSVALMFIPDARLNSIYRTLAKK
jgi:hypothetical protein